jgi:hypothetical protein
LPSKDTSAVTAEDVKTYVQLLYELSAELVNVELNLPNALAETSGESLESTFENLENLLDVCSQEFRSLALDPSWRTAFPSLPFFPNDSTRGTGSGFIHNFTDQRSTSSLDSSSITVDSSGDTLLEPTELNTVTSRLKTLTSLVQQAKWLTGDKSLRPEGEKAYIHHPTGTLP